MLKKTSSLSLFRRTELIIFPLLKDLKLTLLGLYPKGIKFSNNPVFSKRIVAFLERFIYQKGKVDRHHTGNAKLKKERMKSIDVTSLTAMSPHLNFLRRCTLYVPNFKFLSQNAWSCAYPGDKKYSISKVQNLTTLFTRKMKASFFAQASELWKLIAGNLHL